MLARRYSMLLCLFYGFECRESGFNSFYLVLNAQSIAFRKTNLITDKAIYSTVNHTNREW